MYKIAILMSTYNGNDYVEKQIKTIYMQTYKNFELIIRDDGSKPEFVDKLKRLRDKYGFKLIEGSNMGFLKSFMSLLEGQGDADLIAFADQDDIWIEDKLERGVRWFEFMESKGKADKPLLYHAAYNNVESDGLGFISKFYFSEKEYSFRRSITENHYSGFSMIINNKMREYMLKGNFEKIAYHDWWAGMIGKAFGKVYFDKKVTSLHRVHGDNVTTFNFKTRLKWLFDSLKNDSDIKIRSREFEKCFADIMTERQYGFISLFAGEKYSLKKAITKAFYPNRWRPIMSSELIVRALMLIGKI